jgi:hypothetical protein
MLAEASTTEISKDKNPQSFSEHKIVAQKGWESRESSSDATRKYYW